MGVAVAAAARLVLSIVALSGAGKRGGSCFILLFFELNSFMFPSYFANKCI